MQNADYGYLESLGFLDSHHPVWIDPKFVWQGLLGFLVANDNNLEIKGRDVSGSLDAAWQLRKKLKC